MNFDLNLNWISLTALLPLIGAVLLATLPKGAELRAKQLAFGTTLATALLAKGRSTSGWSTPPHCTAMHTAAQN